MSTSIVAILLKGIALLAAALVGGFVLFHVLRGVFWVLGFVIRGVGKFFAHVFRFITSMIGDALHLVGGSLTLLSFAFLSLFSMVTSGGWRKAEHYAKAIEKEALGMSQCLYRLAIGNVARLLCLTKLTEGLEERLPETVRSAPVGGSADEFEGYRVVGMLPSGGSGGRLYLAEPTIEKRAQLGLAAGQVVIKSFSLAGGSTLPQIVRESRALQAARNLGLVLDHAMTDQRFHYVMPYVPGDDLSVVGQRLHTQSGADGLGNGELKEALGYAGDVLETLDRFHSGGLWHKDIKPSNIIVSDGRAYLVDFGLVTPLTSAMTLTTHGTEYFRDPEMVRLALKGVKVHEVDGVRFDIYGAGAVLFSMLENGFPAHGSLSRISKRSPEALNWIVRRAMADMDHRYRTAREMLADVRAVASADDPFAVKPADLPSVKGAPELLEAVTAAADHGQPFAWPSAPPVSEAPKKRKRSASYKAGLAASVLIAGGAAALLVAEAQAGDRSAARGPSVRGFLLNGNPPVVTSVPARDWARSHGLPLEALLPETLARNVAGNGAKVLVLDDLPASANPNLLDETCNLLEGAGFVVVGAGREGADPQLDIDLPAEARAAIGLGFPTDAASRDRLRDFVRGKPADDMFAAVWLGTDGDSPSADWAIAAHDEGDELDIYAVLRAVLAHMTSI